jgi:hypothetical protein
MFPGQSKNDRLKSSVLSAFLKAGNDSSDVVAVLRLFQTRGAATKNARSPIVLRLDDGTTSCRADNEMSEPPAGNQFAREPVAMQVA